MFLGIASEDIQLLLRIGMRYWANASTIDAAILSLDHAFTYLSEHSQSHLLSIAYTPSLLRTLRCYIEAITRDSCDGSGSWRAFGIISQGSSKAGQYVLPEGTFLCEAAYTHSINTTARRQEQGGAHGVVLTRSSLSRLLRLAMDSRAHSRADAICEAYKTSPLLRPCISFSFVGSCLGYSDGSCEWEHRSGPHPLDGEGLHERLRTYCEIILTYAALSMDTDDDNIKLVWQERYVVSMVHVILNTSTHLFDSVYWMDAFCNALYMTFFELGSPHMFDSARVPEFAGASRILRIWICDILFAARVYASAGSSQIPSSLRIQAIPTAALLSLTLDELRERRQPGLRPPKESWKRYCSKRTEEAEALRAFSEKHENSRLKRPGALLYLE